MIEPYIEPCPVFILEWTLYGIPLGACKYLQQADSACRTLFQGRVAECTTHFADHEIIDDLFEATWYASFISIHMRQWEEWGAAPAWVSHLRSFNFELVTLSRAETKRMRGVEQWAANGLCCVWILRLTGRLCRDNLRRYENNQAGRARRRPLLPSFVGSHSNVTTLQTVNIG